MPRAYAPRRDPASTRPASRPTTPPGHDCACCWNRRTTRSRSAAVSGCNRRPPTCCAVQPSSIASNTAASSRRNATTSTKCSADAPSGIGSRIKDSHLTRLNRIKRDGPVQAQAKRGDHSVTANLSAALLAQETRIWCYSAGFIGELQFGPAHDGDALTRFLHRRRGDRSTLRGRIGRERRFRGIVRNRRGRGLATEPSGFGRTGGCRRSRD